jgi:hypothetical protein
MARPRSRRQPGQRLDHFCHRHHVGVFQRHVSEVGEVRAFVPVGDAPDRHDDLMPADRFSYSMTFRSQSA